MSREAIGGAVSGAPLVATVAEDQLFLMARPSAVETRLIYRHQGLLLQLLRHLLQTLRASHTSG